MSYICQTRNGRAPGFSGTPARRADIWQIIVEFEPNFGIDGLLVVLKQAQQTFPGKLAVVVATLSMSAK